MNTKQKGIKKVIKNNQSDYEKILPIARTWTASQMKEFTSDDFRAFYEANNKAPSQPKIYGAVFSKLHTEERIKPHGTTTCKRPEAHSRLIRTWISKEYSSKQANNRRLEISQINLFKA